MHDLAEEAESASFAVGHHSGVGRADQSEYADSQKLGALGIMRDLLAKSMESGVWHGIGNQVNSVLNLQLFLNYISEGQDPTRTLS